MGGLFGFFFPALPFKLIMSVVMSSHSLLYLFKCHVCFLPHISIPLYIAIVNIPQMYTDLTAGLLAINIFAPCILPLCQFTTHYTIESLLPT